MHALPNSTVDLIARWPLGFVATIDAQGRPAVSPKGTFLVLDDATIGFANIRSPGTTANLKANPEVEVNFIDFITRKGARLRGKAAVMSSSTPAFETHLALW
ncbi:MAG: pyridoxamine 5'-phosphate oxidase family protein, partial [Pseudomonadota bacterium]